MNEEKYDLILKTPMGAKKGELIFEIDGDQLNGKIIVKGEENPFSNGTIRDNNFSFSGVLKSSVGKMEYEATGQVDGDTLRGEAKAKKGTIQLTGKRK